MVDGRSIAALTPRDEVTRRTRIAHLARLARPGVAFPVAASIALHAGVIVWARWAITGPIGIEVAGVIDPHETVLTLVPMESSATERELPPEESVEPPTSEPEQVPPEPASEPARETAPDESALISTPVERPEPPPIPEPVRRSDPAAAHRPMPPTPIGARASEAASPSNATVFAGVRARRASRVVYVVDASGPMASSLAFVKRELERSIASLSDDQVFQVVFFREPPRRDAGDTNGPIERGFLAFDSGAGSPALLPATSAAKDRLADWLGGIRPTGRSNLETGLSEALKLGPDLVFVLSRRIKRTNLADAAAESRQILAALDRLNPSDPATGKRTTIIKTIQFLDEDPTGLLRAIAQTHGDGADSYKLLTIGELPKTGGSR